MRIEGIDIQRAAQTIAAYNQRRTSERDCWPAADRLSLNPLGRKNPSNKRQDGNPAEAAGLGGSQDVANPRPHPPLLLKSMAPDLGRGAARDALDAAGRDAALAGPAGVPHRDAADGQAQADVGPVDGLRRLRGGDGLRGAARDGAQEVAEDVLPAQHAAGIAAAGDDGRADGEARWRGGAAQGGQRDAAQEPAAGQEAGAAQGVRGRGAPVQAERDPVRGRACGPDGVGGAG
ncbi:hypothetical protein CCHR01_07906 [Colletotrichum chrysophilum]|uniref:Uncharacterized protein n=1 Tax=Colletotrichum chrysophilum TaxID=1836956 RepID=A0AAD9AJZ4_9PEZI|nr:hypothetical protein CCHR01_07906 [Colletotrichum chrysophilum]